MPQQRDVHGGIIPPLKDDMVDALPSVVVLSLHLGYGGNAVHEDWEGLVIRHPSYLSVDFSWARTTVEHHPTASVHATSM